MDKIKLKDFLYGVEKFYQPENPEQKDGIGHEVEHIKGVIRRTDEIIKIMNDYSDYTCVVDKDTSVLVACLHDIGNVISRDDHGHLAYGIIMGELSMDDILNVPIEYKYKEQKEITSPEQIKELKDFLMNHKTERGWDLSDMSDLSDRDKAALLTAATIYTKFHIISDKKNPIDVEKDIVEKHFNINNETDINKVLNSLVERNSNNEIIGFKKNQLSNDETKREKIWIQLKSLSKELKELLKDEPEKLKIIADAVQDHNIDFCINENKKVRYEARSIYGMIIADADKDNVAETFALRTYAFSLNKWAKEMNPDYFADKQHKPKIDTCLSHIMHQSWERFKPEGFTDTFADCFQYKKLDKIKGIERINTEHRECFRDVRRVPSRDQHGLKMNKETEGQYYIVSECKGDDIYSQLDTHFHSSAISLLRKKMIETCQNWADPKKEEFTMKYLRDNIATIYEKSKSIEDAIDVYEKKKWGVTDNSFHAVINDVIEDEKELNIKEQFETLKEQIAKEREDEEVSMVAESFISENVKETENEMEVFEAETTEAGGEEI